MDYVAFSDHSMKLGLFQVDDVEFSDHDMKSMMHSLGVVGQVPCDTLLNLHRELKSSDDIKG